MIAAIALDLGSTSVKAGLLDRQGNLLHIVAQAVPPVHSDMGHYESDALSYAETADRVLAACLAQTADLPVLGLCSQRSSFLIWEQSTGKPVIPLISWQDSRGAESCLALQAQEAFITGLTGLRLAPYYFAPKLRVVLQQNPQFRERLERGELLLGTLDTFLIWRWTDGKHHLTDASMAARTLLMDIHKKQWSSVLCDLFSIPLSILPAITPSTGMNIRLNNGLTLQASLGDQSAALFASVGQDQEAALVNLGTGGFVIRYLAENHGNATAYLRTLVYQEHTLQTHLAVEGTLNSIAAALAPYPVAGCSVEEMGTNDIFCLAEPSGLGAPFFRQDMGVQFSRPVANLSQHEIGCLLLEAIIFRVVRILEAFHREARLKRVYLAGGLSVLPCLQEGIARCFPIEVCKQEEGEASLQGAALLAAGMEWTAHAQGVCAQGSVTNPALRDKYLRWNVWLDRLLDV